MNNIQLLLETLHGMVPLSRDFKKRLVPLVNRKKELTDYHILLKPNTIAKKSWYLIRGLIIVKGYDKNNNMIVPLIYYPGQLVTDLPSFFEGEPVKYRYIAIKKPKVLELTKLTYQKLLLHPETNKLAQRIILSERAMESARAELLVLPEGERVNIFLSSYPVQELPDKYAAAFLRVSHSLFKVEKSRYLLEGNLLFKPNGTTEIQPKTPLQRIYEINAHIHTHFKLKDIEEEVFQMMGSTTSTRKTMERNFSKNFGTTTLKLILKLKIEEIKLLLEEKNITIQLACKRVHYLDVHNFSRNFKREYGYTPIQKRA